MTDFYNQNVSGPQRAPVACRQTARLRGGLLRP
jgi:hypothetical protein